MDPDRRGDGGRELGVDGRGEPAARDAWQPLRGGGLPASHLGCDLVERVAPVADESVVGTAVERRGRGDEAQLDALVVHRGAALVAELYALAGNWSSPGRGDGERQHTPPLEHEVSRPLARGRPGPPS